MQDRRGLTLVEAAVVLVVLVLLVAVFVVSLAHMREKRERATCASNLRQIALAMRQYAQDNGGALPSAWAGRWGAAGYSAPTDEEAGDSLSLFYPDYIDNPKTFSCPGDPSDWQNISACEPVAHHHDDSYSYDPRHTAAHDPAVVILADKSPGAAGKNSPNHAGRGQNLLFLDRHVEWVATDATRLDPSIWTDDSAGGRFQTDSYLVD